MLLIDPRTLHDHIDDPNWVIVDCRAQLGDPSWGKAQYLEGHIPNARFVSVDDDMADEPGSRGRHPLPTKQRFCELLGSLGISKYTQVVAYDDRNSMFACRFWWMVRWVGHGTVSILDGGSEAWLRAGYELTATKPNVVAQQFVQGSAYTRTIDVDEVLSHDGGLLDARGADRFHGQNETIDHTAGHIPGAVCQPFLKNLNEDGTFNQSSSQFSDFHPGDDLVCYCGSGVSATHNIMALLLAGYAEPALYPGSWSEWIEDNSRPIATD